MGSFSDDHGHFADLRNAFSVSDPAVAPNTMPLKIIHNDLENNRYFGIVFIDGNHTSSHDTIAGGNVGVAVVATSVNSVGTFAHDKITDVLTPVQELSRCGVIAQAVVVH